MGEMISYPSNGSEAQGYLARPEGGDGPGVVVVQEWWGLDDHIRDVADRFAGEGFVALAPDLYDGTVVDEPDEAGKLFMALDIEETEKKLRGAVARLNDETGGAVGTVGFCMGGALSLFAACKNPSKVGACVDFYGIHPAVEYDWDALAAPVLGIWADQDEMVIPNVPGYEKALSSRDKPHEFVHYPQADHAFFNDTRPEVYREDDAADAWSRTLSWFREHL
jgi:carboxymethylenebutenolidase